MAAIVFGLIRFTVVAIDYQSLGEDPDAYRAIAEGWSASGTVGRLSPDGSVAATAYRPPLYPWLLSWFASDNGLWLPGVAGLHILLGSLTCLLTLDITKRLLSSRPSSRLSPRDELLEVPESQPKLKPVRTLEFASRREATTMIPWLAGLAVAFDPILLRQSCLVMTETTATFMSILIWWFWIVALRNYTGRALQFSFGFIGILLGISCLLRPTTLVWCVLLVVALFKHTWRMPRPERRIAFSFSKAIFLAMGVVLVLSPWAIRNRMEFGSTIWTTTHGGYTLLLANNPVIFQHLEVEGISRDWDEGRFHELWSHRTQQDPREPGFWTDRNEYENAPKHILDEINDDRLANQVAWATIVRSPWTFVKASFARTLWLWALWPFQEEASPLLTILVGVWYFAILSLFAYGSMRAAYNWFSRSYSSASESDWLPAVALIIGLAAVHAVYWSNMRMRAPVMPMVVVIAAISLSKSQRLLSERT